MPTKYTEEQLWMVPGLIPTDGLVIFASAPKTGKTCFATALARAVATGQPFLGKPVKQGPVLWCSHEETYYERAALHEGLAPDAPFYVAYPSDLPALDEPEEKTNRYGEYRYDMVKPPYVFEQAVEANAKLIVIDCLHAAVQRGNLAENQWARFVMGRLRRWSFNYHVSVLVLHHLTKSATRGWHPERFADSAQILAAASCHFFLERTQETQTQSRLTLHGRGRAPSPYNRIEIISEGVLDYRLSEQSLPQVRQATVEERIVNLLSEGWTPTVNEVASHLQISPNHARIVLLQLKEKGSIETTKTDQRTVRYALR